MRSYSLLNDDKDEIVLNARALHAQAMNQDAASTAWSSARVSVGNALPTYSYSQIAAYLTDGYWDDQGGQRRSFNIDAGQTLSVNMTDLNAAEKKIATWALQAWTAASGIKFSITTSSSAKITFTNNGSDEAWSTSTYSGTTISSSIVNISSDWVTYYGTGRGTYSLQTYIHEIGHALGLGHAGDYNGNATYGYDNHYANDSWQATIMSYFDQDDNTFVNADFAWLLTPMIADVLAIRRLYGTTSINGGNTTYDYESTFNLGDVAMTIVDTGGSDLLDFSWLTAGSKINLNAGTYSDVDGLVGNFGIAYGTVIEKAKGGSGSDQINGNSASNQIWGNGGNDKLFGSGGNDSISGGSGNDRLYGGTGKDSLTGGSGRDTFYFNTKLSSSTNVDRINDFSVADDTIALENSVFTKLTKTGTLFSSAFTANKSGFATDSKDRIIYETDTGKLFYDSNGNASGGRIQFAQLDDGLKLTYKDFLIV
ncbi:M10 family metallopeptidase [Ciceribacter sp. L1K23]|uniref:M10 family metallopeptidase n=1 Tax=Ciceribacter sp. L1K23 TaxID=2820276 RepID=UPI001B82435A|nr:M10 family metallopeptidase [Ciceribacter sp. L1K23]MBR0555867.1 M10 family metallopeptidase [Ciceribacter sp. L1K23]